MHTTLQRWHEILRSRDPGGLAELLADEVVFHSPIVHKAIRGKALVAGYLAAAMRVLGQPGFRYVREIVGERDAVLEFELEVDGLLINGVDLIRADASGRISDFKVMLRPQKAAAWVQQRMHELLLKAGLAPPPYKPWGHNALSPYLCVDDAAASIAFMQQVLGAQPGLRVDGEGGRVRHAELRLDDSVLMISDAMPGWPAQPANLHLYVPDVRASYARALAAGAESLQEPLQKDDEDLRCGFRDPGGISWWLATQQRERKS